MVHTLAFWFVLLDLSDPPTVTMTAANYLAPRMDIPDTFQVSMSYLEKLLFTFTSIVRQQQLLRGEHDYLFGTKATLIHTDADEVHIIPQGTKVAKKPVPDDGGYKEMTGLHMQNFFDCVRSRKEPVCPFELGFRTSIACQMAVASYRRQTTVRWTPRRKTIV